MIFGFPFTVLSCSPYADLCGITLQTRRSESCLYCANLFRLANYFESIPMNYAPRIISLEISPENEGKTVARILKKELGISESILRKIRVANAGTYLDGVFCRTDAAVKTGQILSIDLTLNARDTSIQPEEGTFAIAYEDEDLLIINKAAGIVVHPSRGHRSHTLCNFVAHYLEQKNEQSVPHPVNRLDRETTGLVVFAKHAHAQNRLSEDLHTPRFERNYLALCEGADLGEGTIDAPIARITDEYGSFGVREDGKRAVTHYQTISSAQLADGGKVSLIRLTLETGRTHQIRVHMSHIGHPLLGDTAYGRSSQAINRPALHSHSLRICHPVTRQWIEITADLPDDMASIIKPCESSG